MRAMARRPSADRQCAPSPREHELAGPGPGQLDRCRQPARWLGDSDHRDRAPPRRNTILDWCALKQLRVTKDFIPMKTGQHHVVDGPGDTSEFEYTPQTSGVELRPPRTIPFV